MLRFTVILALAVIVARLFYLQVIDDSYKSFADNNVLRHQVQYPPRGEVYDRRGEFLVQSKEAYDLMVIPRDVKGLDTTLLCSVLGVTEEAFAKEFKKAQNYSRRRPSVLFKQLPKEVKLKFEEYSFPGFYTQYRTIRSYPRKIAGNLLGYVSEVNQNVIDSDPYYRSGDYMGWSGIEKAYEKELRGEKGVKIQLVDVHGVPKGDYADGEYDVLAVPGAAITSTLDARLQQRAEDLLEGFVGSIVAIEPSTGEILVMASSPSYDPDEMIGRERGNNYMRLLENKRKPLFNRAVSSTYPPGSTFKMVTALMALQEGVIVPSTRYACNGGFFYGNRKLGCHAHESPLDLYYALQTSCNAYFCNVYNNFLNASKFGGVKNGFDKWEEYVRSFGFGRKLDSDFINEGNGIVRTREYYDKEYRGSWNGLTTISLSIGQGEVSVTPLQMANFIATIANRGYYYIPHVVKAVEGQDSIDAKFYERHYSKVDKKHFDVIAEAMWRAVNVRGTAVIARMDGFDVCGKTGTAQNPQGADHSTFACFAPLNDPKIAVSVYIEHGGFGATAAGPIASLLVEEYLTDTIARPELYDRVKSMHINYPMYDR